MPTNILMPALSPTMEKGNLAKWHVKEGDKVSSGDVIAEIETDKATMEVEAVDEGTVARIVVPEGTADVPVNDVIAVLAGEGEDIGAAAAGAGPARATGPGETDLQPAVGRSGNGGAPQAAAPAADPDIEPKPEVRDRPGPGPAQGYGREEPGAPAAPTRTNGGEAREATGGRVFASPLARRMAREAGLDLSAIPGSGPHGRVVKRDVEAAAQRPKPAAALQPQAAPPQAGATEGRAGEAAPVKPPAGPTPAPARPSMPDEQIRKLFAEGSYEVVPHDSIRKTIARRLTEAKSTIPHFYLTIDVALDELLKLRADLNKAAPMLKKEKGDVPAYKLSVNDMVIKALAMALQAVPDANVTWTSEGMLKHRRSDVGVAVSIPGGLITPVVREADRKTLSAISNEMKDMAARARARKLRPDEYQGGTTAVSNLGMFGVKDFAAVINPPHATILAVGAGEERVVVKDGAPAVATMMSATLSTDHRAVDGALGAELLAAFKGYIEKPIGMLV